MNTLRERIEQVNDSCVGFYLFFNTNQEDYCKARSLKEAAKLFQKARKRLTGKLVPLATVTKFITPDNKAGSELI